MGFGNSEQNFGMIASKFTVAMWYTHPSELQNSHVCETCSKLRSTVHMKTHYFFHKTKSIQF